MSAVSATKEPRRYKRLDAVAWAEAEALWGTGTATLEELSERFGVTTRGLQSHFAKAGISKGMSAAALSVAVRKRVEADALPDVEDLAVRASAIRERAFNGACQIEAMLMAAATEAAADPSKLFAFAATAKAAAAAAQTLERLHGLKRLALGMNDDSPLNDELPVLTICDLTADDVAVMRAEQEDDSAEVEASHTDRDEVVMVS